MMREECILIINYGWSGREEILEFDTIGVVILGLF